MMAYLSSQHSYITSLVLLYCCTSHIDQQSKVGRVSHTAGIGGDTGATKSYPKQYTNKTRNRPVTDPKKNSTKNVNYFLITF